MVNFRQRAAQRKLVCMLNSYQQSVQFEAADAVVSTSTTTEYRHNVIADGQVIAVHTITQSGSASTDYLHYDHLGSVDAITDDQGSVIQAMSFDAFGLRRDATNWDYDLSQSTLATLKNYTDGGYTDQEQLDNLSLVDMNGRVYDPTVGRMISADPTVPALLFSQAFNRFAYVYDNPLEFTDPTGFVCSADTHTEVCDEMDGGSTGYFSGGGTGNAGADQPGGPGDVWANLGDSNDNSDPNQSVQITPLGGVYVFGFRPIPIASLLWWMNPCFTCSLHGSFFNPLTGPTQQNQESDAGKNSKASTTQAPPTQTPQQSLTKICSVQARILEGNQSDIGQPGGLSTPTQTFIVTASSAAVIPSQWGGPAVLRKNYNKISGSLNGAELFDNIADSIGGTSPVPGMSVQQYFLTYDANSVTIELPGMLSDLGTQQIDITVPASETCPEP